MKALFSFWSKPYGRSLHKSCAGFPNEHYLKTSFELALLTARKQFSTIELVTDTEGVELLVNRFGLTFDSVDLSLNDCQNIPANMWAAGKLKAYSLQKEPFIHLDYDLFLLKNLPNAYKKGQIVVQSKENFRDFGFYEPGINLLKATHKNIPVEFNKHTDYAFNAGLLGGNDWQSLADYGKKAFQLILDNLDNLSRLSDALVSEMNVIYEQAFIARYAEHHNIKITTLVEDHNNHVEVENAGLVHLFADSKNNLELCEHMARTLEKMKKAA
jgi:hypothetical protein